MLEENGFDDKHQNKQSKGKHGIEQKDSEEADQYVFAPTKRHQLLIAAAIDCGDMETLTAVLPVHCCGVWSHPF